ncbi:MAG: GntR family transcriptional regulator [Myxococcota bacterium]
MSAEIDAKRPARSPRLADRIAASLRDRILCGEIGDGEPLPTQERLMEQFSVSQPPVREALRILEADGLITVRRGKNGGAIVHAPGEDVAARAIASILQARTVCLEDVGQAIRVLEPICCELAARRRDRARVVLPELRRRLDAVRAATGDAERYRSRSARFHQELVQASGNQTLATLVGALEALWAAHARARAEGGEWARPVRDADRERYARAMSELVEAIEAGDAALARERCSAYLARATRHTLVDDDRIPISAALVADAGEDPARA